MTDSSHLPDSIDDAKFSVVRKGYDKREVREFLQEVEQAFRDMENWSKRAKVRLAEAEEQLAGSQTSSDGSVDNAMFAVFDAKDRILDKARRRAEQIEAEAIAEAEEIKTRAERLSGDGSADDVLAAAREEAQDIIERAKREASKLSASGGADIDALQHQMAQKDEQLSSMRNQLLASKTDAQVASSGDGEMVVQAQAMADQLIREAQDKADRIVAHAESRAAEGGEADAAAAAILESAKQQAAEIEARATQMKATAEEVLADAQSKFAAAREAEAAAEQAGGAAPFGGISDDALMSGMQGELAEVHEKVEARRAELTELHDLVEERRNELRDIHDAVESRKSELQGMPSGASGGETGFDLAAVEAEAADIVAKAQEEASQVRAEAMRMLAETEQERASVGAADEGAEPEKVAALEEEISALQASQAKAQQQSAAWAEVVDELKVQVADLNEQLEAKEEEVAAAAHSGGADEAKRLRAEIKSLVLELDAKDSAMESATAALREEGDALATRVAELTAKLESSGDQAEDVAANSEEIDALQVQLTELSTQLQAKDDELEASTASLRDEGDALASRVAELTSQLEAKDEEIAAAASAGEEAAGFEKKVAELSARLEVKEEELEAAAGVSARVPELETQIADLSSQLESKAAESDQVVASLREESEALAARVGELNSGVEAKDAELEAKNAELEAKNAEIEGKNSELAAAAEATQKISSLEAQVSDLSAQLEAKAAELETTSASLREESAALASRVAELSDVIEANVAAHETAKARAARVEPLSQELTKAQVTLREQRAEIEKVAEVSSAAQELRSRVETLESDLAAKKSEANELPKLRVQVDGLKIRAAQAEEAAEFANSQLTDLLAQADQFEQDAIRRAAAAEAHRIREMTEDSLGIARDATTGTGLDADDYVPATPIDSVAVSSDPDDWSDVFAAADAIAARLAGEDPAQSIEAELAATAETEFTDEDVELTQPAEFVAPTPVGEGESVAEADEDDSPDPVAELVEAEVVEAEVAAEVEVAEEASLEEAVAEVADDVTSDTAEVAETSVPEAAESEVVESEVVESEVVESEAQVAEDLEAGTEAPEVFADVMDAVEDSQPFEDFESAVDGIEDTALETVAEEPVTDDPAGDEPAGDEAMPEAVVAEVIEPAAEAAEEAFAEVQEVVDEAPVADAVEEHLADESEPAPEVVAEVVDVAEVSDVADEAVAVAEELAEVAPLDELHPDTPSDELITEEPAVEAAIASEEAVVADDVAAEPIEEPAPDLEALVTETEPAAEAEADSTPSDDVADADEEADVVPIGMAERLRLARAELEAELDPDTVPAQDIPAAVEEQSASPEPEVAQPVAEQEEVALAATFEDSLDTAQGTGPARETRYARQSAKLPRITESEDEDADGLTSMSRFRARMLRGKNKGDE